MNKPALQHKEEAHFFTHLCPHRPVPSHQINKGQRERKADTGPSSRYYTRFSSNLEEEKARSGHRSSSSTPSLRHCSLCQFFDTETMMWSYNHDLWQRRDEVGRQSLNMSCTIAEISPKLFFSPLFQK
eukprot:432933-Amphidinium_carterae.1